MKKNILKKESNIVSGLIWYRWEEFCDICGRKIRGYSMSSTKYPNIYEEDRCAVCMMNDSILKKQCSWNVLKDFKRNTFANIAK